jgi:hypothetical protein
MANVSDFIYRREQDEAIEGALAKIHTRTIGYFLVHKLMELAPS